LIYFKNLDHVPDSFTYNGPKINNFNIELGAIIYPNCEIGEGSIIGSNAVLRPGTKIGHHSIFGTASVSEGDNEIGNFTTIHAQCHITKKVRIGNDCFIAPFFIATNTPEITVGKHGTADVPELKTLPTVIGDRVRIGANVRLIPGITIGNDAVIDQDCLITRDVYAGQHIRGGKDKIGRPVQD